MSTGIGTVFVFLALLVLVMMATGRYFKINEARFREVEPEAKTAQTAGNDLEQVAAVMAAITHHLRK